MSEENVSSVAHHDVVRSMFSLLVQKRWASNHIDIENVFPNGILEWIEYMEMPAQVFTNAQREEKILKLRGSLYGLREAVRMWNNILFKMLVECGLEKMEEALYIFEKDDMVFLYYLDNSLLFVEHESLISKTW